MKTAMFLGVLLLSSSAAAQSLIDESVLPPGGSQRDEAPEVVADTERGIWHHGGYGAGTLGFTHMGDSFAPTFGARGVWRINRQFGLGLTGTGIGLDDFNSSGRDMEAGYGGLLFEYVMSSNKRFHPMFDVTIGGGALCERTGERECEHDPQGFFVVEPTANLEVNLTSWMRLDAGAGYRLAAAHDRNGVGTGELSGFVGRVNLAFGRF